MNATKQAVHITANKIEDDNERMQFLPSLFGTQLMMRGESLVFNWMRRLCETYNGGYWNFYTLSNGGFYMAPHIESAMHVEVVGNGFCGDVSADAAGIIATGFALNQLIWESNSQRANAMYSDLLAYGLHHHPEKALIYRAID